MTRYWIRKDTPHIRASTEDCHPTDPERWREVTQDEYNELGSDDGNITQTLAARLVTRPRQIPDGRKR